LATKLQHTEQREEALARQLAESVKVLETASSKGSRESETAAVTAAQLTTQVAEVAEKLKEREEELTWAIAAHSHTKKEAAARAEESSKQLASMTADLATREKELHSLNSTLCSERERLAHQHQHSQRMLEIHRR